MLDSVLDFMLGAMTATAVYGVLFWPTTPKSPVRPIKKSK